MKEVKKGEIILYQAPDGATKIDVKLKDETVWLTQAQMAELFDKDVRTVNEHIQNVYKEGELDEDPTIRKFRIVQTEGKRNVERETNFYNLDVIISVGYRVKSKRGAQFRIWANSVLKDYLVKGYSLNEKRLAESKLQLEEIKKAIDFIKDSAENPVLEGQEKELLNLISDYANSLILLEQFDEDKITPKPGVKKEAYELTYEKAREVIDGLKSNPEIVNGSKALFGNEFSDKLKGIMGAIYQTFGGEDLYPTIEDKAAHILYLIIKDHPFSDGNKRIGSFLFVYYLDKNHLLIRTDGERRIGETALVSLALLVAVSNPRDKEIMIKLTKRLIQG